MRKLDLAFVRNQFPAFFEPPLEALSFFENAGGSYICAPVLDRLARFHHQRKVQPYGSFEASRLGGAEMDEARTRIAALLNVGGDELHFGPSTSQNTYVLAQAFGEMLGRGDAIVVTNQDHEANSGAWWRLARRGIEIREWQVDPQTGALDPVALAGLLDDGKVRLVCFPHCSNILGEINPVTDLCTMARESGAWSCVDGVSYAPHGFADVSALGADIYLFSSYKTYGPHLGVMVIRRALAGTLPAQGHDFNAGDITKRFTPAGPDHAQIAAATGMADYVDLLHERHFGEPGQPAVSAAERAWDVHGLMRGHEMRITAPLLDFLAARNDIRLLGPSDALVRAPTVSLLHRRPGAELAEALEPYGIMAGGGDFYAVRLLRALGIDPAHGVLRLSFTHYTSQADVERLMAALDAVL
ncbi:aminotransferase class V-fold PLP-dependent enzyme [Paroceanicella profunda]|uniref:Aminotransferase class V-fold PLP-dependent enzyme n=1 Tax=Paroceanicella profunda TaxID=2579971 RepID=A0A5B8FH47_9RHOB|nr:aminotransferase class V-fold PLP-dependent enzyme [Paroceanicella profunda]QDL91991.1 aminotransferase class V-fold PLP-dependent enzyme [Paroceanicella profunda]